MVWGGGRNSPHPCASSGPSVEALPPLPPCWGASQCLSPPAEIWHPEPPHRPPPLTGPQWQWLLGPPLTWDRITDQNFKAHPRPLLLWAVGVPGLSRDGYNWKPARGEGGVRSSCPEGPKWPNSDIPWLHLGPRPWGRPHGVGEDPVPPACSPLSQSTPGCRVGVTGDGVWGAAGPEPPSRRGEHLAPGSFPSRLRRENSGRGSWHCHPSLWGPQRQPGWVQRDGNPGRC